MGTVTLTMRVVLLLLPLLSIASSGPVSQQDSEDRWGLGLIEALFGITTAASTNTEVATEPPTPAPSQEPTKSGIFGLGLLPDWPNNGGLFGFGIFGKTTAATTTTTTTTKCGGLIGGGLLFC